MRVVPTGSATFEKSEVRSIISSALGLDLSICTQREAGQYVSGESEQRASDKLEQRASDKLEQRALDKTEQRASNEMKQHTSAELRRCALGETKHRALGETGQRASDKPSLYDSTVDDQEYEALLQKAVSSWLDEALLTQDR